MTEHEHSGMRQRIEQYFLGALPAAQLAELRAHLRDCDACRSYYDRRAAAEQKVLGVADAAQLADQRLLQNILQDPQLQTQAAGAQSQTKATGFSAAWLQSLGLRLAGLGTAAALAGLILFVVVRDDAATQSLKQQNKAATNFHARGGDNHSEDDGAGLGLIGLRADGSRYDARRPEGLSLNDSLAFSYSNPRSRAKYLFVFAVDPQLRPYWYYPLPKSLNDPGDAQSVQIEGGPQVLQRELPYATELRRRHHAGILWVYAIFSEQPLQLRDVQAWLERARAQHVQAGALDWRQRMGAGLIVQRSKVHIVAGVK